MKRSNTSIISSFCSLYRRPLSLRWIPCNISLPERAVAIEINESPLKLMPERSTWFNIESSLLKYSTILSTNYSEYVPIGSFAFPFSSTSSSDSSLDEQYEYMYVVVGSVIGLPFWKNNNGACELSLQWCNIAATSSQRIDIALERGQSLSTEASPQERNIAGCVCQISWKNAWMLLRLDSFCDASFFFSAVPIPSSQREEAIAWKADPLLLLLAMLTFT